MPRTTNTKKVSAPSAVKPCTCQYVAQDVLHGRGMRVMSPFRKKNMDKTYWRCSVCLREH